MLARKGIYETVVKRSRLVCVGSETVVVVNIVLGSIFTYIVGSFRLGDAPSMFWVALGMDPVLIYLERRQKGIL